LGEIRGEARACYRGRASWIELFLTLHAAGGERLVGFDNAHPVRARRGPGGNRGHRDHKHRMRTVRPYEYTDAARLLEDFWTEVESVLAERGVKL
jgi:hypothetical protein